MRYGGVARTPRRVGRQHRTQLRNTFAADQPSGNRTGQLAAMGGLLPLVAEQRAGRDRIHRRLSLARPVGAEHVQVQPGPQIADIDHRLGPGSHAADDLTADRLLARADPPAELVGQRARRAREPGSEQTPGPYPAAARQRAVQHP